MKAGKRPSLLAAALIAATLLTGCASEERLGSDRSWTRVWPW